MADNEFFIRTSDPEAGEMLRKLADDDKRSMGNEVAVIIREAFARRFSRPSPVTLAEIDGWQKES